MMKDNRKAADIKHNDLKEYLIAIPLTLFKGYWEGKKDALLCSKYLWRTGSNIYYHEKFISINPSGTLKG